MKYRHMGKNGPMVSALGFGCMGLSEFYGAPTSEKTGIQIIIGISFVAYCPIARGLLSGTLKEPKIFGQDYFDFRTLVPQFDPGNFEQNLSLVTAISAIGKNTDIRQLSYRSPGYLLKVRM